MKRIRNLLLVLWSAFWLTVVPPAFAQDNGPKTSATAAAADSVDKDVASATQDQSAARRKQILQEAVDALANTKEALSALEENRVDEALEALALTTGKLELIVARAPELALAPTDVAYTTHDIYGSTQAIKAAISEAEDAIDDGKIQHARRLLDGLGSEVVITVTNLPLATYPAAIKMVIPLIDDGKIDEAKQELQAALNTVVLTKHVLPLPVMRAESLLEQAETLTQNAERSDEENAELKSKLAAVRAQLEMAQVLGYGDKEDYSALYAQLKESEKKTEEGHSGTGVFDRIKTTMTDLWNSVAGSA